MQNTFYLSSSCLAWHGNEMAQTVTAFETQPEKTQCMLQYVFFSFLKSGDYWKSLSLLRGETNNLFALLSCMRGRAEPQWMLNFFLSLNETSGDSLTCCLKKGE